MNKAILLLNFHGTCNRKCAIFLLQVGYLIADFNSAHIFNKRNEVSAISSGINGAILAIIFAKCAIYLVSKFSHKFDVRLKSSTPNFHGSELSEGHCCQFLYRFWRCWGKLGYPKL